MEFFKSDTKNPAYTEKALTKSIRLKKMVKDAKIEHFDRIREKVCQGGATIYFIDILNNLDAMGSENYNIAQVVSGKNTDLIFPQNLINIHFFTIISCFATIFGEKNEKIDRVCFGTLSSYAFLRRKSGRGKS
jgi:hypothetical protein